MLDQLRHHWNVGSRREFFTRAGSGLAAMALAAMVEEEKAKAAVSDPLSAKQPHHAPTAKSVIFLFMEGGPSHVDLFDYKPALIKMDGQPIPDSIGKPKLTAQGTQNNTLMAPKRVWKQRGESGMWVSDWYENAGAFVDEMSIVRSCWTDGINHVGSVCEMNTGSILAGRPSLGAWSTYGLGTANKNLPTFVVMTDDKDPLGGANNWSSGFLPAVYQGTQFRRGETPILDLKPPAAISDEQERNELGLLRSLNEIWSRDKSDDSELDARIRSYELAYQMQSAGAEAVDLSRETAETRSLYGLDDPATAVYGGNCLMARRLVERGVRFVQLYHGGLGIQNVDTWDAHTDLKDNHSRHAAEVDRPIAGLLTDLKSSGLMDSTLVVWQGEFGRMPISQRGVGRDHNPGAMSIWMAGARIRGGQVIGSSDEFGYKAEEQPITIHDLHASILNLMGMDHTRLTYRFNGRDMRLTDVYGDLIPQIVRV
jgi:hypothetical protein